MKITTIDVLRFVIIAFTLFITFRLLSDSLSRLLIQYILPITAATVISIVWKLFDHPVVAQIQYSIRYLIKKYKEFRIWKEKLKQLFCGVGHKEELKQFFRGIACKIEMAICGLEDAVSGAVAWLLGWLQSTLGKEWQQFQNKETPEEVPMRVALLVSTRSGPCHEAILRAFTASTRFDILLRSNYLDIEWDSTETIILHRLSEQAAFARSFSICLIPYFIWTDDTKTLLERFSCGTYWEYLGEGKHLAGDCLGWGEDRIKTIDSVLELGLCTYTNEIISQELYKPLCNTWTAYDPVWWNTLDFAIRQAWLLADYGDKRRELKTLYNKLTKKRFFGAIRMIFGRGIILERLYALTHGEIVFIAITLSSGGLTPLFPFAFFINWKALSKLLHGLRFNWDEAAKEVESAIPQLDGLVDR